jgi:hypothetical protein
LEDGSASGGWAGTSCGSHAAATAARRSGQYAAEAEALDHAARFGDRTVADRLGAFAETLQGPVVGLYARHASAAASADAGALDAVSTEFEALGLMLSAADAAAQASLHDRAGQSGVAGSGLEVPGPRGPEEAVVLFSYLAGR